MVVFVEEQTGRSLPGSFFSPLHSLSLWLWYYNLITWTHKELHYKYMRYKIIDCQRLSEVEHKGCDCILVGSSLILDQWWSVSKYWHWSVTSVIKYWGYRLQVRLRHSFCCGMTTVLWHFDISLITRRRLSLLLILNKWIKGRRSAMIWDLFF